jgi:multisubunit Na+/H+ antiporter MnhC subunit
MALAGVIGTIVALRHQKFVLATFSMTVATFAYPSVIYALPAFLFALVAVDPSCRTKLRVARRLALGLLSMSPYVALWIHDQVVFHRWNLYSQIQSNAGVTVFPPKNPLRIVWHLVIKRDTITQVLQGPTASWWIAAQFLIATGLCGTAAVLLWRNRRAGLDVATEVYPVLIGLSVYTGVFLSGTTGGVYRGIVVAAPAVLIFRRASLRVLVSALVLTTIVTIGISTLYFDRTTLYNALLHGH